MAYRMAQRASESKLGLSSPLPLSAPLSPLSSAPYSAAPALDLLARCEVQLSHSVGRGDVVGEEEVFLILDGRLTLGVLNAFPSLDRAELGGRDVLGRRGMFSSLIGP